MPQPPPSLRPLPLDEAAILAAIDACTRTAAWVEVLADARAAAASTAREEWRGATRDRFDAEVARLDLDAAALVAELRRAAGAIGSAAGEVAAENRRRATAAEAWRREQAAVPSPAS